MSSKFSFSEKRSRKLEESIAKNIDKMTVDEKDDLTIEEASQLDKNVFVLSEYDASAAERGGYSNYSYWRSTVRMFFKNRLATAMLIIMAVMVLFTFIQPILPNQRDGITINNYPEGTKKAGQQLRNRKPTWNIIWDETLQIESIKESYITKDQLKEMPFGERVSYKWTLFFDRMPEALKTLQHYDDPIGVYIFGTNDIGQDLWSLLWQGTRTSLYIGIMVAIIQALVGVIMGMLWGYVRQLDFFFTELYNIVDNIPTTIILILATYIMKPSISTIIIAMSVTGWLGLARFIRNQVIIIRDRDFNLASRCLGTPTHRVIVKNLLPQMVSVVMLRMGLAIPYAISSEVFLTYIGLGLPTDTPSLGNLVNKGRQLMMSPSLQYQLWFPAIILSIITICFYLVGNAFADAADPKNHV